MEDKDLFWPYKSYKPSKELENKVSDFICEIDKPGAILTVFDEGKVFARCDILEYEPTYCYVMRRVWRESKNVVIRVGGYSYRAEGMAMELVKELPKDRVYLECLSDYSTSSYEDPRIRVICMRDFKFDYGMDIVQQAEEYDFKTFSNEKGSHCMVYYYVNNIDTGFYDKNGVFYRFYSKDRGLQAITDVIMINGYEDIAPATGAICTFTFDSEGDRLYISNAVHKDRRSRTSSQRMLIEKAGIKLLDLTNKKALETVSVS